MRTPLSLSLGTLAITVFFGCSSGGTSDGLTNFGGAGASGQEGEEGGQAGSGGSGQSGKAGASQAGKAGSNTGAGAGGTPAGGAGGSATAGAAGGPEAGAGGSVEPFGGGGTPAAGSGGGAKAGAGGSVGGGVGGGAGGSSAGCDPLTNAGCDTAGGQACDFADTGYTCYDPPNDVALCGACDAMGPYCKATTTCLDGKCTPFCQTDGDCKGKGVCDTDLLGDGVGVCVKAKGQGDSATNGCGGGAGCDPVTNAGCDTAGGQACDFADTGYTCYDPPNDVALCGACDAMGPYCKATTTCFGGQCTPFCQTDGDCKGKGVCDTDLLGDGVGVCVKTKGQGDSATSGCGGGTGGAGGAGGGGGCNPVTNEGCDTAKGYACDLAQSGSYQCFEPPNNVALCGTCDNDGGPFCQATTGCLAGKCTPQCQTDADCKGKGVCDTQLGASGFGLCAKAKGQGDNAVSGCGG